MNDRRQDEGVPNRRVFLRSGIIFSGAALAGAALLRGGENDKQSKEIEVGPPEDLMREHGVLKRVLLIYGEALRRLYAKQDLLPEALADAAGIIRSFVEDYHEKLEEDFLFPRFEKANQLVDLVKVLREQHQAGRRVTDITTRFAKLQSLKNESERTQLVNSMQQFIRMRRARTPSSFPRSAKSFRRMSSILSARILRRRRTSSLAMTVLKRWWTRWLRSRSDLAFTISRSSRRRSRR